MNIFKEKDCYLCYMQHDKNIISCYGPFNNFMVVDKFADFIPSSYNQSSMLLSCPKLMPMFLQYKYLRFKYINKFNLKLVK